MYIYIVTHFGVSFLLRPGWSHCKYWSR